MILLSHLSMQSMNEAGCAVVRTMVRLCVLCSCARRYADAIYGSGDDLETADYVVGGPWMVVFDSAVTEEEADRLVEMGATEGYERSLDVTETYADGTLKKDITAGRTSTNAWCTGPCAEDASAQNVASRMEHITGIPEAHAEHLQLLRYTEGQFYQVQ